MRLTWHIKIQHYTKLAIRQCQENEATKKFGILSKMSGAIAAKKKPTRLACAPVTACCHYREKFATAAPGTNSLVRCNIGMCSTAAAIGDKNEF